MLTAFPPHSTTEMLPHHATQGRFTEHLASLPTIAVLAVQLAQVQEPAACRLPPPAMELPSDRSPNPTACRAPHRARLVQGGWPQQLHVAAGWPSLEELARLAAAAPPRAAAVPQHGVVCSLRALLGQATAPLLPAPLLLPSLAVPCRWQCLLALLPEARQAVHPPCVHPQGMPPQQKQQHARALPLASHSPRHLSHLPCRGHRPAPVCPRCLPSVRHRRQPRVLQLSPAAVQRSQLPAGAPIPPHLGQAVPPRLPLGFHCHPLHLRR